MVPSDAAVLPGAARLQEGNPIRSRALRRLDWRFLLPRPPRGGFRHMVLLGGSDQMAHNLRRLGVARTVSQEPPGEPLADVLVMLVGAATTIDLAVRCLRPGGVLFYEVDRRSLRHCTRTPRRVRRELQGAGITPTGTFWVKPNLVHCGMYLPLELDHAVGWYFETLYQAQSWTRRALRGVVRLVTGYRGERLGRVAPCFAVTGRMGPRPGPEIPDVLRTALTTAQRPDLPPLVSLGGEGEWSRVVMLPFRPVATKPAAVVKFPRVPLFNAETVHERKRLHAIRDRLDAAMGATLPQPLAEQDWNGLTVTVESLVDGRPLSSGYDGKRTSWPRAIRDLQLASAWLGEFHRQTQLDEATENGSAYRLILRKLQAYTDTFGRESVEAALVEAASAELDRRPGARVPIVCQHNDFGPWNVYRSGDMIRVIDWEVVRDGPAGCDLVYFVVHWNWQVRRRSTDSRRQADLAALWVDPRPADDLVGAARTTLLAYLDRLAIDGALLPVLLVYTLVEQALDRQERKSRLGDSAALGTADNPYVHLLRALAKHTPRLFPEVCSIAAQNLWWQP